jgi:hypothetical protein
LSVTDTAPPDCSLRSATAVLKVEVIWSSLGLVVGGL